MGNDEKKPCPECKGNKIVPGTCECNMEWRGTQSEEGWDDCQCNKDEECPMCHGKGYVD